jgi:hypothetical protein
VEDRSPSVSFFLDSLVIGDLGLSYPAFPVESLSVMADKFFSAAVQVCNNPVHLAIFRGTGCA